MAALNGGRLNTEPPDGGYGWVIVVSALICNSAFAAMRVCFSVYITELTELFDKSQTQISLIASIELSIVFLMAIPSGALTSLYGSRTVCLTGLTLAGAGLLVSSFVTNYYLFIFTYGVVKALGHGLLLVPTNVIVQRYFLKRRAVAVGVAAAGRSLGPTAFGPMHRQMIEAFGWRGGMMLLAGIVLQGLPFAALMRPLASGESRCYDHVDAKKCDNDVIKVTEDMELTSLREPPRLRHADKDGDNFMESERVSCSKIEGEKQPRRIGGRFWDSVKTSFHVSLVRQPLFIFFILGQSFVMAGEIAMFTFTVARGIHQGVSRVDASFFLTSLGASAVIGRIAAGVISSRSCVRRLPFYATVSALGGVIICLSTFVDRNLVSHIIVNVLYGLTGGANETLYLVVAGDLFGVDRLPGCLGWGIGLQGLLTFFYVILVGILYDVTLDYRTPFLAAGSVQMAGGLVLACIALVRRQGVSDITEKPKTISEREV